MTSYFWPVIQFIVWILCFGMVGLVCYFAGKSAARREIQAEIRHRREVTRLDDRVERPRDPDAKSSVVREARWTNGYW